MTSSISNYGNKLLDGNGLLHLVGTIKAEIANGNNSGITEDDIKDGITIEMDHEAGEDYSTLELGVDTLTMYDYDGDGRPIFRNHLNEVGEIEYDDGEDTKTEMWFNYDPLRINFYKRVIDTGSDPEETIDEFGLYFGPNRDYDGLVVSDGNVDYTLATLDDIPDLPTPSLADEGKAIAVNSTGTGWSLKQYATFPSLTNNAGKILAVNSGGTGVEWITAPSSGTTYTAGTGISIVNGVISINLSNAEEGTF